MTNTAENKVKWVHIGTSENFVSMLSKHLLSHMGSVNTIAVRREVAKDLKIYISKEIEEGRLLPAFPPPHPKRHLTRAEMRQVIFCLEALYGDQVHVEPSRFWCPDKRPGK
jgi:hypothetical protein